MTFGKSHFRASLSILLIISFFATTSPITSTAHANTGSRSLVDRPDEITGYQVHLVYVALKGSIDTNWDTNGKIDSWVTEANSWLMAKVGRKFIFDTYQGTADVSFMPSKYTAAELCKDSCEGLEKLVAEYSAQDVSYSGLKSTVFVIYDKLSGESCGWATTPSNQALLHNLGSESCGEQTSDRARFGMTWPPKVLIHELMHTYGIGHLCFDDSDMMIGSPECSNSRADKPFTLDLTRTHYVGSNSSDGIDLLKMPIWSDGSGSKSYSEVRQISDNKYVPTLNSKEVVYAVVGKQSGKFVWDWEKEFNPDGVGMKCQFTSGLVSIFGTQSKSACVFNIPDTLRAGQQFTVTQSWVEGPWHGEASTSGVLVRDDLSSNPCTDTACFVGGTTIADYSCWKSDVKSMKLQQIINGKWVDFKTVSTKSGSKCLNSGEYINYPELALNFKQTGTFVYRWFVPARPGFNSFTDKPFAIVVNVEKSAEPSQDAIISAQAKAVEMGKAADAAKKGSTSGMTITCTKGTLSKRITGANPKCPLGYKKK